MRIFIAGIACVGKTTVGAKLAALLGYPFFDLDKETEKYFGVSLERHLNRFLTGYSYRKEASEALTHILAREDSRHCVIALPPSGLRDAYWRVVKKANAIVIVLHDSPENILKRITFYDIDSKLINRKLSEREKKLQLREIKLDISFYRHYFKRANMTVNITGLQADGAALKVRDALMQSLPAAAASLAPEQGVA
ncbi:MAG: AAA family ATPase [Candidatus Sumerlaeota bacterium]|nr:AAA family ATPase [Candidatus Sumerlaeota bacterium]